jgi:hypothetical protein
VEPRRDIYGFLKEKLTLKMEITIEGESWRNPSLYYVKTKQFVWGKTTSPPYHPKEYTDTRLNIVAV